MKGALVAIAVNEVCFLKTTEEPCFVLEIIDSEPRKEVVVRRPVVTARGGITHVIDKFFLAEMEPAQQKVLRNYNENQLMLKRIGLPDEDVPS